jgi:8-oxo-dGTP diphosphatase
MPGPVIFCMIPGHTGIGAGALIIRNNRALMLLRTEKCRNCRHMWTIPGGTVEPQEDPADAVRREALEETGLTLDSASPLTVSDRIFDGQHWISHIFLCGSDGTPVNKEPDMHEKMEWLDIDGLPENVTMPSKDAIDAYRHRR